VRLVGFIVRISPSLYFCVNAEIRGSFKKFCTLYVLSLKMNLFYKIHLQAFNVISIVLYHSGPTFGQSCTPVRTPSFLMRLITQVTSLDTPSMLLKRFPRSGFFNFGNKSKSGGLSPLSFQTHQQQRRPDSNTGLAQTLYRCDKAQWRLH
jgi:hypothetical protein